MPDRLVSVAPPSAAGGSGSARRPAARPRPPAAATSAAGRPGRLLERPGQAAARARGAADDQRPLGRPERQDRRGARASTAPASRSPSSPTASTRTTPGSSARTAPRRSSTTRTSTATARTPPTSGAEAFGDASRDRRAGQRRLRRRQLRQPGRRQLPGRPLLHPIVGVAPGADVVALKAGSELLPNSAILQAIDYAVTRRPRRRAQRVVRRQPLPRHRRAQHDPAVQRPGRRGRRHGHRLDRRRRHHRHHRQPVAPTRNVISTGAVTDSRLYEQTGYALAHAVQQRQAGRTTTSRRCPRPASPRTAARSTCRAPG